MQRPDDLFTLSRRALECACAIPGTGHEPVYAVDCTAGNGHDTVFLAGQVGPQGRAWAFDVQKAALAHTALRLREAGLSERVTLLEAGHEQAGSLLPAYTAGHIRAAVFNLGFLPGSDRRVVTRAETTLAALEALHVLLAPGGVISAHCYAGHPGGAAEREAAAAWFAALPWERWRVTAHTVANKKRNPEILFLAARQGS